VPEVSSHRTSAGLSRAVDATVGRMIAAGFAALSALRHRRVFHPHGAAFEGTVAIHKLVSPRLGAAVLDEPRSHRCVVRLSRGIGVAEPRPDILGIAVRILDVDGDAGVQDLLLVTAGERPILRNVFLPCASYTASHYSSILPVRVGDTTVLVGLRPRSSHRPEATEHLDDVARLAAAGRMRFGLEIATPTGPWQPVGTLDLGRRLSDATSESLRFDVFNTARDIRPVGLLNTLRRRTYRASQRARAAVTGAS
jgi:hypothetical protein